MCCAGYCLANTPEQKGAVMRLKLDAIELEEELFA